MWGRVLSDPYRIGSVCVLGLIGLGSLLACAGKAEDSDRIPIAVVPPAVRDPLPWHGRGVWLAGDTHTHYLLRDDRGEKMLRSARETGLDFVAKTDHAEGILDEPVAQRLAEAQAKFPELLIVPGVEWNIPAGDHATVLIEARGKEWEILRQFTEQFDRKGAPDLARLRPPEEPNEGDHDEPSVSWAERADAHRALGWLRDLGKKDGVRSVVYLNHLSRHRYYGYADLADLRRAGVAGFEAAAGHQRNLPHQPRLHRYDPVAAVIGGDWDRLLADGPFGISASSDYHNSTTAYRPGAFSVTRVYAAERSIAGVIDGLARGATTTSLGGVVSAVETATRTAGIEDAALIGETLVVARGARIEYEIRLTVPPIDLLGAENRLDRVEVITNAATGVARVALDHGGLEPGNTVLHWKLPEEATTRTGAFFVRARGCRSVGGEGEDEANADLCFYTSATRVEVVNGDSEPGAP